MADEFNPRKPKNSCDVNDRWNAPEWATNAGTFFGTSNSDISARPNSNYTDQFRREIPICWEKASARFGSAALLAEKSPLSSKIRPLFQCTIAPSDAQSFASIFLVGIGYLSLFSRRIKDFKADGTELTDRDPKSESHNTLYEVSFYLPEQGTIKFKVLVDKDGKITPALNEARNFLDKAVAANQPNSSDFAIESSTENLNQFTLKSGSIELTVNLEFTQEKTPPASDGTVSYYNQRVILAKSQPPSPLKIGNEAERARFASQKKAGPVTVLQRQTIELLKEEQPHTYPAHGEFPARTVVHYASPGKVYLIMLSDGNMAAITKMNTNEKGEDDSFLYIPDQQTGEMKEIELINTGKGFVAEGYEYGFKIEKAGAQFPFTLVNRKTIEPEKIDLQKELEALAAESRIESFSRENQYINKFRRAVIATFIGNEHLLSGSDLLAQLKRRQGETLDTWRVRVIRALDAFKDRANEFKVVGSGYSTSDAPKHFFDRELNSPPSTRKPKLYELLRTPITNSDLERRINEIPEPRSLILERGKVPNLTNPQLEALQRDLAQSPSEAEEDALASLPDHGEKPVGTGRVPRDSHSATGAAEPPMSIPEIPPAVTPPKSPINAAETVDELLRNFSPLAYPPEPRTVTAYSAFGNGSIVTAVTVEYLGMNVKENGKSEHCFRLSVVNGPTIYIVVNKTKNGSQTLLIPITALINGKNADELIKLGRNDRNLIVLKSEAFAVTMDPLLLTGLITGKRIPDTYQLIVISGFTPRSSVPPPAPISRPDEPMSIDPSLTLLPQTAFTEYQVREEVVETVANRFGIAIDSIWDLAGPAHRGMSLDQITQTGNHFVYGRADSRLQIEFDRSSTNPHFADIANLKIIYDGQPIPFEYAVEHNRPYLFLKARLHGVVFYLSPTDQGNYGITEATHPVIREQAERDMGYTASSRPDNIPYPKIRENFLSLPSDKQTPEEQILVQQIYRNRLGRLKEAGVLPTSLKEQTLIAKRLGADAENFDRRNVVTFSQLHKLEEIAKDEKLKEQLKEGLQRLAVASDDQKTEEALALLQRLESEVGSGKSKEKAPIVAPPVKKALAPEPAVSEAPAAPTPPVCEAPLPADQTKEPLVSTQPPPNLLIRALESLGETGQKLINALFPSEVDAATKPILEDADVRDSLLGIARFLGVTDEQLTALLSSASTDGYATETVQISVDRIPEPEAVCQEPAQSQSIPPENVGENPTNAGFDENEFMQELNKIVNRPKTFAVRLEEAISYTKASGSPEIQAWLLRIEESMEGQNKREVLWSLFDSLRRYPEATTPVERKIYNALGKLIKETAARTEAVELLKKLNKESEKGKKEEMEKRFKELMDKP